MSAILTSPLSSCLVRLAGWILSGIVCVVRPMSVQYAGRTRFLAGALCGVGVAGVGFWALAAPAEQVVLPIGLPDLPFHVRLDALSAVFLLLTCSQPLQEPASTSRMHSARPSSARIRACRSSPTRSCGPGVGAASLTIPTAAMLFLYR